MRFLVVDAAQVDGGRVSFDPEQEQYLARVLRLRAGDSVEVVVAGAGRALTGTLEAVRRGFALRVTGERALPAPPAPALTLAMGLIKGPRLETVVRMATELGVNRLALVACARAVVDWSKGGREDRLAQIAVAASQQSGNAYPPVLERYASVAEFVASARGTLVIAVAQGGGRLGHATVPADRELAVLVGPEGDFTAEEVGIATAAGGLAVTLTCPILRAESAALVLGTLMLEKLGRL